MNLEKGKRSTNMEYKITTRNVKETEREKDVATLIKKEQYLQG